MSCLDDCRELYTAIKARTLGKAVQSSGHKDRSASFANADLGQMIKVYIQLRAGCAAAQADPDLPVLTELEASTATRGVMRIRMRS